MENLQEFGKFPIPSSGIPVPLGRKIFGIGIGNEINSRILFGIGIGNGISRSRSRTPYRYLIARINAKLKQMGSRVFLLKGVSCSSAMCKSFLSNSKRSFNYFGFPRVTVHHDKVRSCSSTETLSSLPPPDVTRLAETARIALTSNEVILT